MFQLLNAKTFRYKVKVKQARDTGGLQEFEFTAEYRRLLQPEIKAVLELGTTEVFRKVVDELWTGWVAGDIKQPDGSNLDPSTEGRAALMLEPGVPQAIVNGWLEAVFYGPAKN
jgi:hypothetical protein